MIIHILALKTSNRNNHSKFRFFFPFYLKGQKKKKGNCSPFRPHSLFFWELGVLF